MTFSFGSRWPIGLRDSTWPGSRRNWGTTTWDCSIAMTPSDKAWHRPSSSIGPGTLQVIAIDPRASSYTAELEQSVALGARALVLVTFPPETILILREALEFGYYDQFVFSAPTKTTTISAAIGAESLAGMRGTFVDTTPANEASDAWMMGYLEEYDAPPAVAYVKETYDATLALALAAEAAGSSDGAAIRDQLRRISSAPGLVVIPHPESIAAGLQAAGMGAEYRLRWRSGTARLGSAGR